MSETKPTEQTDAGDRNAGAPREADYSRYMPGSDYRPGAAPYRAAERQADPLAGYEGEPDAAPADAAARPQPVPAASSAEAKRKLAGGGDGKTASSRKRRSSGSGGFFQSMTVFAGLIVAATAVLIAWGYQTYNGPGPSVAESSVVVERGDTFTSIVPKLVRENVIASGIADEVFPIAVRLSGRGQDLQVGEFAFRPGASMRDVIEELTEGRPVVHKVVFPEGWTVWRMWERLVAKRNDGLLTGELPDMPPEGTLLPATYTFTRGKPAGEIVDEMRREFERTVERIWEERDPDLPIETPEELVTLASIVEKETGMAGERAKVAGVFVNRLRRGMRLQSDPTIIYGIWGGQGKPEGRGGLRRSEINKRTAYNTYRIDGLPPGPIANPGREALRAVANPADTDALYFVADGTGGHAFARTLREHNRNVAKWRQIERERADEG